MNAPNRAAALADRTPFTGRLLIDGQWVDALDGATIDRASPAHGHRVSVHALGGVADADRAVLAARRAFDSGPWQRLKGAERAALLRRVADAIVARVDELAMMETLENGKPLDQAKAEITGAADLWHYAATLARTLHGDTYNTLGDDTLGLVLRDPIGVVSIVTPWNFPFLIVSQKLPFALAAGCTAVVKPSEFTSATTLMLGQILLDAGLPPGVVNIVVGLGPTVGERLVTHPEVDMLSFTGSTGVGKHAVAASAATLKKVSLELGGKNPQIVFADADLDAALDAAVYGATFNAGQCCNAGSRLLLQESIAGEFTRALAQRMREVRVGDPLDAGVQVGAITTPRQYESILGHLAAARDVGASLVAGGRPVARSGQFIEPTVVAGVTPDMPIARDEVFGPVVSVLTFASLDDAVRLANSTAYGLSAAVWSRDTSTAVSAARGIRAGTVWLNTFLEGQPELPFGGYRLSGIGRELGRHAVDDYTETKTLYLHIGRRTSWWLPRRNHDS